MQNNNHILGVITAFFLVGILITTHVMSAHPPVVSERIEADGYLEKSRIDSRKTLIYNKNGKVFGYTKKNHLDSRKTVVYDTNDNVKGYLQQDLLDFSKFSFSTVNDY